MPASMSFILRELQNVRIRRAYQEVVEVPNLRVRPSGHSDQLRVIAVQFWFKQEARGK